MSNLEVITRFYEAFADKDAKRMNALYAEDINFYDPAFGFLKGERAGKMWEMLLSRKNNDLSIQLLKARETDDGASGRWKAEYVYGPKKRKVVNIVEAKMKIKDDQIIEHFDHFNLWRWSRQALGIPGILLGWTGFFKKSIQKQTNSMLDHYIKNSSKE